MHYEHYALVAPLYGGERPFGGSPRPMHYEKFWQVCIMTLTTVSVEIRKGLPETTANDPRGGMGRHPAPLWPQPLDKNNVEGENVSAGGTQTNGFGNVHLDPKHRIPRSEIQNTRKHTP
jgi:hypothetical protein